VKLRKLVASKLILDWSPEQISGWLKIRYPADESMRVSQETIYRSLFIQARGVLKKELLEHLRSKRRIRRSQHARIFKDARGQIVMPSPSGRGPQKSRTAPSLVIGKAISLVAQKQSHRDVGGTTFAFYSPGQSAKQRHRCGCRRVEPANSQASHIPAAIVDLGSRAGDG
jgi:hypothetical protein